jgi:hypothetical protein
MVMTTFALGKLLLFLHAELSSLRPRYSVIFCNQGTLTRNHVMLRCKGFLLDKSVNVVNVPSEQCRFCLFFLTLYSQIFYLLFGYGSNHKLCVSGTTTMSGIVPTNIITMQYVRNKDLNEYAVEYDFLP